MISNILFDCNYLRQTQCLNTGLAGAALQQLHRHTHEVFQPLINLHSSQSPSFFSIGTLTQIMLLYLSRVTSHENE